MKILLSYENNKQEFIVSIAAVLCLAVIAVAILVKQSRYDIASFGLASDGQIKTAGPEPSFGNINTGQISPSGFKALLKDELYNRDNLHEKINGKATLYLESGFRKMMSSRYVNSADNAVWMELFIYDMGDVKNAFSVYGQQKRADSAEIPDLGRAYAASNALFMAHGRYYIEIIGSTKSAVMTGALLETGSKLKSELKTAGSDTINELSMFDKKYIVPGSEKQYPRGAFGFSGFTDVFSARYRLPGSAATVFVSVKSKPEQARLNSEEYARFCIENGGVQEKTDKTGGVAIINLFGSFEAVTACGKYVAGVHEADNQRDAEKFAEIIMATVCGREK